jgi:hypothetical protein
MRLQTLLMSAYSLTRAVPLCEAGRAYKRPDILTVSSFETFGNLLWNQIGGLTAFTISKAYDFNILALLSVDGAERALFLKISGVLLGV